MMSEAIVSATLSRPKIHRLPALPQRRGFLAPSQKAMTVSMAVLAGLTMVAYTADRLAHRGERYVPQIPDAVSPTSLVPPVEVTSAAPSAGGKQVQTIVLTGKSEGIVGQMAKIPMKNEQITEIESVSGVDNKAGPELLGIVNKY